MKFLFLIFFSFSILNFDCEEIQPVVDDICDITTDICFYANEICSLTGSSKSISSLDYNFYSSISNNRNDLNYLHTLLKQKSSSFSDEQLKELQFKLNAIRNELKAKYENLKSK